MAVVLSAGLVGIFLLLGGWHLHWALGGTAMKLAAVPERVPGQPLFRPSAAATAAVGLALLGCALLIAAMGGLLPSPLPQTVLSGLCAALALALLARAVGDFRWVGFFKRERHGRFARYDSWAYSPLCLALGAGVLRLAIAGG